MPIWVGSPEGITTGDEAAALLRKKNDKQYYHPNVGVVRVDYRRWRQAQDFESRGWLQCWSDQSTDRNQEHATLFDNYKSVPTHLGHVLEVGCGPFTQLQTILKGRTADSVTLLDPLLRSYPTLAHCPYKTGSFQNLPTTLWPQMAEELIVEGKFDTVICINVIEHVMNVMKVLENIRTALKPGGILIFGERAQDDYNPMDLFDVGHPIRVKSPVLEGFRVQFTTVFQNKDYFIGQK